MRTSSIRCAVLLVLFLLFVSTSCSIIDIINGIISSDLPQINDALHNYVPESVGNCNDNSPPQPCDCYNGCANLYYVHKSWLYEAYARWITGLKTGNLTSVVFSESDQGGVLNVEVNGFFAELPLSLWIGECLTFDDCVKLWDNTDGCCGTNKKFQVYISVDCGNTYPYLTNIRLDNLTMDQFEITEKIVGINVDVKDITSTIESVVTGLLTDYLTKEKFIPLNGTKVTVLEFSNSEIYELTRGAFTCPTTPFVFWW